MTQIWRNITEIKNTLFEKVRFMVNIVTKIALIRVLLIFKSISKISNIKIHTDHKC